MSNRSIVAAPAAGETNAAGRSTPLVALNAVTKAFGPTLANSDIDFAVAGSDVIGLVGGNGAGKSTLMRILLRNHYAYSRPHLISRRRGLVLDLRRQRRPAARHSDGPPGIVSLCDAFGRGEFFHRSARACARKAGVAPLLPRRGQIRSRRRLPREYDRRSICGSTPSP